MTTEGRRVPDKDVIRRGVESLRAALDQPERVAEIVRVFYDDEATFAGRTFLGLQPNDPDHIDASDLLVVTLMGEMFPAAAVRRLLDGAEGDTAQDYLRKIDAGAPLWKMDIDDMHSVGHPALELWRLLDDLWGIGPTKASKLMARKRPSLIPIYDRVIGTRIARPGDYWYVFHAFLSEKTGREAVEEIRCLAGVHDMSLLRVLDTAIWMRYSSGEPAQRVREEHWPTVDP